MCACNSVPEQKAMDAGSAPQGIEAKREEISRHYSEVAAASCASGHTQSCGPAGTPADNASTTTPLAPACSASGQAALYDPADIANLPLEVLRASRGCADPHAIASLKAGETVLDLGCGGGIDAFIAAREVGAQGKVIGLDMTDEMLALAEQGKKQGGYTNVEFIKGFIEDIPLPDSSVDVVISNCVINLSTDKGKVLEEAFRVLKPGGRFAVADIVALRSIHADELTRAAEFFGCRSGVMTADAYACKLREVDFADVVMQEAAVYTFEAMQARAKRKGASFEKLLAKMDASEVDSALASMLISAFKAS